MNNPPETQTFRDFGTHAIVPSHFPLKTMKGLKMSLAALTVTAHVSHIVLPVEVLTLMDRSPAILRVLLGTIEKKTGV